MYGFCAAVAENQKYATELKTLLREAVNVHRSIITKTGRGLGFAALCHALEEMIAEDEPIPAFFEDPTWNLARKWATKKIKTHSAAGFIYQEAGFFYVGSGVFSGTLRGGG